MLDKKFLGLIGLGYWGKNLARDFHRLGVLKTVSDVDNEAKKDEDEDELMIMKSEKDEDEDELMVIRLFVVPGQYPEIVKKNKIFEKKRDTRKVRPHIRRLGPRFVVIRLRHS